MTTRLLLSCDATLTSGWPCEHTRTCESGERDAALAEAEAAGWRRYGTRELCPPCARHQLGAAYAGAGCQACGRPYSPDHDAAAPGPTVRHPFTRPAWARPTARSPRP